MGRYLAFHMGSGGSVLGAKSLREMHRPQWLLDDFTNTGNPNELQLSRFAFNCPQGSHGHDPDGSPTCKVEVDQAFTGRLHGINRPTTLRFGPDGALYLVDYGAVRDPGGSDPASKFVNPADAPLVQIPGTGVIWRISRDGGRDDD